MEKQRIFLLILIVILSAGVVLLIIGAALTPYFQQKIDNAVKEKFALAPGSDAYKRWLNGTSSQPVYEKFYVFNVTNPDRAASGEEKPHLQQIGPYTYRVEQTKQHAKHSEDETEISYTRTNKYIFEPLLSEGNDTDDFVTTANIPIVALASMLRYFNETIQKATSHELLNVSKELLFTEVSVRHLLWGYKRRGLVRTLIYLRHYFNITPIHDPTFGLEYRHGQKGGVKRDKFTIGTGTDDIRKLMEIYEWDTYRSLPYWTSVYSNSIKGTDATGWSPYIQSTEKRLQSFQPDWYRSVYYERMSLNESSEQESDNTAYAESDSSTRRPMWTYTMPHEVLDKSMQNAGFCTPSGQCTESGVLNVTVCRDNFTIYLSQPHFYQASDNYTKAVDGLSPDSKKHRTQLAVEPVSGYVTSSELRLQYNVEIKASDAFSVMDSFKEGLILPVAWKETIFNMSDSDLDRIESYTNDVTVARDRYRMDHYRVFIVGAVVAICSFFGLVVLILVIVTRGRSSTESESESETTEEGERRPLLHDQTD